MEGKGLRPVWILRVLGGLRVFGWVTAVAFSFELPSIILQPWNNAGMRARAETLMTVPYSLTEF